MIEGYKKGKETVGGGVQNFRKCKQEALADSGREDWGLVLQGIQKKECPKGVGRQGRTLCPEERVISPAEALGIRGSVKRKCKQKKKSMS